jgi:hypothetical protein
MKKVSFKNRKKAKFSFRILIMAIAIGMFAISCGGGSKKQNDSSASGSKDGNYENIKMPTGWSCNDYYWHISGKWDSSVLPDCVPAEIEGIKTDQTFYKHKAQDVMGESFNVGKISFKDARFEEWGMQFYCTNAQLAAFVSAMDAKKFFGGKTNYSDYTPEYEWVGNGYYAHLRYNPNISGDENYDCLAFFNITKDMPPRPKAFKGNKYPDFGWVTSDYSGGAGWGWANDKDVNNFYDVINDKGDLPADGWNIWVEYFGVSVAQAKTYKQTLVSAGWEVTYEQEYEDEEYGYEEYECRFSKSGMVAGLNIGSEGAYTLSVGFGSSGDYLWY